MVSLISMKRVRCKTVATTKVAVGTRIAPRPPRRSQRALLTHRAPPSGQTACDKRLDSLVARRTAFLRIDADARRRVRTAAA